MKYILVSFILIIATAIFYFLYNLAVNSHWRISPLEARSGLQNGNFDLVLDVRTGLERASLGYYPGSVHVPAADLEKIMPIKYPNKSISILVYCNTGHRARLATDKLIKLGYVNSRYIATSHLSLLNN